MSDLTFSRAGTVADANSLAALGTLMWIGDSTSPEFSDAYQHCLAQVAQLAMRRNFDDALCRPATAVRCILVTQSTRQQLDRRCLEKLRETYPDASFLNLQGTLCEGMRGLTEPVFGPNRHYWHRWNQILPEWLGSCGVASDCSQQLSQLGCRSVAVLTSTFVAGESLMDLAESAGATAVWCRRPDTHRVRNVDAVWWDDSVAGPTSSLGWRERIAAFASEGRSPQHAWIVNAPRLDEKREATRGGIDVVVSKPHRINCLVEMLANRSGATDSGFATVSRAA
jgi:hypothetical protein